MIADGAPLVPLLRGAGQHAEHFLFTEEGRDPVLLPRQTQPFEWRLARLAATVDEDVQKLRRQLTRRWIVATRSPRSRRLAMKPRISNLST